MIYSEETVFNSDAYAFVALGGNTPSREGEPNNTLRKSIDAIKSSGLKVDAVSSFYATPCFPKGYGPDYVNAVVRIKCDVLAEELLKCLHEIELSFERRREVRWGSRTLDLDLLSYGAQVLPDRATFQRWYALPREDQVKATPEELILPHPRIQDRAFVLVPLVEIAPDWVHPVLGQTAKQLLHALPEEEIAEIQKLP